MKILHCIQKDTFEGKQIVCKRGLTEPDYIFNDEEKLKLLLSLNEEQKSLNHESY